MLSNDSSFRCKEDTSLTTVEKDAFREYLQKQHLQLNIWDFFEQLKKFSTAMESFFFIKVYTGSSLVGLGIFSRVENYNLFNSFNSKIRRYAFLEKFLSLSRFFSRGAMYCAMSEILCVNITEPFFYKDLSLKDRVKGSIISYLKQKKDALIVAIMDSSNDKQIYMDADYNVFPYPSNSWIDVTNYDSVSEYYTKHNRTRKNIAKYKKRHDIRVDIQSGVVPETNILDMKRCLSSSAKNTRSVLPFQNLFNRHVFETEAFSSDKYVHIMIRMDDIFVGFTTFKRCDKHLGGILGGFDRNYTWNNPIYDLLIVSALEYALQGGFKRICLGIVNNLTKFRLTDTYENLNLYFHSRNFIYRTIIKKLYPFMSMYEMYMLEKNVAEQKDKRKRYQ
jgi:hypothetical protein